MGMGVLLFFYCGYLSTDCGENITDVSSGFITSPNFHDGYYPAYSRCTWIVQTEPGTRIQFHFTDFSTNSGDYVTVKILK